MEAVSARSPNIHVKELFGKRSSGTTQKIVQRRATNKTPKTTIMDKKFKKEYAKMSTQNEELAKLLRKKNAEISDLKHSSDSLNNILSWVPADDLNISPMLANRKLAEVNNQNRKLNVELMVTKKQLNKKDMQLKQKDLNMRMMQNKLQKIRDFDISKSNKTQLKGHMNDLDKMISTVHSKNVDLLSQLNAAQKCLQMETGYKWDIKEFLHNPTDWQGRAQKIEDLELQVKHYNEQIDSYKKLLNLDVPFRTLYPEGSDYDTLSAEDIIKRAKIKTLETENSDLRKELEKQKSIALNLRVRNESLNEEVLQCRTLICSIEEHSTHSKNNMASLRDMVIQQQLDHEKRLMKMNDEIHSLKEELEVARAEEKTTREKLEASEDALREGRNRIEYLLEENKKLEDDLKSFCGGYLFSCRDLHKDEFIGILETLENEKMHLLGKIIELEEKLEAESSRNEDLSKKLMDQVFLIENLEQRLDMKIFEKEDNSMDSSNTNLDNFICSP